MDARASGREFPPRWSSADVFDRSLHVIAESRRLQAESQALVRWSREVRQRSQRLRQELQSEVRRSFGLIEDILAATTLSPEKTTPAAWPVPKADDGCGASP